MNREKTRKWGAPAMLFLAVVLITALIGCASFEGEIPIEEQWPEVVYISPLNQDGIQDEVRLSFTLPEMDNLHVTGYKIAITSESGKEIYSEGVDRTEDTQSKKEAIPVPQQIVWNGKNAAGGWVPDGTYTLTVSAWDDNNNRGEAPPMKIVVDNTPPILQVSLPYSVFSPNGDSSQDVLQIYQTKSSSEGLWEGIFYDSAGTKIRQYSWKKLAVPFQWDGKNDAGDLLGEGEFSYVISSTDAAGNTGQKKVEGIRIDNRSYPISIAPEFDAFSPNGDGVKDTVRFILYTEKAEDIVEGAVSIIDTAGNIVREVAANRELLSSYLFDGKNAEGKVLPNGDYFAKLMVKFKNGDSPEVLSNPVVLDVTPPSAVLSSDLSLFSPDGDGRKDQITIHQSSSAEELWEGVLLSPQGKELTKASWTERSIAFTWDGTDQNGAVMPDGVYSYRLTSTDRAGNTGVYRLSGITIDTRPTPVKLTPKKYAFSPNNDGREDSIEFEMAVEVTDGISGWRLAIVDSAPDSETDGAKEIFSREGIDKTSVPPLFTWNGEDNSGEVREGIFTAILEVDYEKGNLATVTTDRSIVVDLSPPVITASVSPILFSPDEDGVNDLLTISVQVEDTGGVRNWTSTIMDPQGNAFRSLPADSFANGVYRWNGRSRSGELVQAASNYTLVISAEDNLRNTGSKEVNIPIDILVLREENKLKISISTIFFKPNTADYLSLAPEMAEKNLATLDRLAEILKRYGDYNIRLEGHAVRVFWDRADKWLNEENEELLPLSKERADAIRNALIQRGIKGARMTTNGLGGYAPVVPHSDMVNRWKNRRVEFILLK